MMLTSSAQKSDAASFRAVGISAYLTKPARPAQLLHALGVLWSAANENMALPEMVTRHSLAESRPVALAVVPETRLDVRNLRVLLAEDNIVNQKVARRLLEKTGCQVDVATNGVEAVDRWAETIYDIIFMDCQMPEMDGYRATQEIRSRERALRRERTPIVALTANTMAGDAQKCLDAGMDDFIPKPIPRNSLGLWIERCSLSRAAMQELDTPSKAH